MGFDTLSSITLSSVMVSYQFNEVIREFTKKKKNKKLSESADLCRA